MSRNDLFLKFMDELSEYYNTGVLPSLASQDLKHILQLRHNRLQKLGLTEKYDSVCDSDNVVKATGINIKNGALDRSIKYKYGISQYRTKKYYLNNKRIYKNKQSQFFYETIIDAKYNVDVGNILYNCPNCGAPALIKSLQEKGCAYCRTKFIMSDLFPKVTNYYTIYDVGNGISQNKSSVRIYLILGVVICWTFVILDMISKNEFISLEEGRVIEPIFNLISTGFIGMIAGYFLFAITTILRLIIYGISATPLTIKSLHQKADIDKALQQFNPTYSYEYFESKLVNYLKIILFSDNLNNISVYSGPDISNQFTNLVDINFKHVIDIQKYEVIDNKLIIEFNVYLQNEYLRHNSIIKKDELLFIKMQHNTNFKTSIDFSISAVSCRSCGGTFDATYQKNCPFCHQQYSVDNDDWLVTEVKKLN